MKKKFNRYLSHRVLLLTLAAAAFFGCFLIAAAVYAVRDGAHALLAAVGAAGFAALCYAAFKWVFLPYQETKRSSSSLWAAIRCRASTTCATRSAPRWRTRCSACAPSSTPTS